MVSDIEIRNARPANKEYRPTASDFDFRHSQVRVLAPQPAQRIEDKALFGHAARAAFVIPKFIPRVIPKFCCLSVRGGRDPVRMLLPSSRQCSFHCPLGVTFIGPALVRRENASLTVRQLSFFKFGHTAMSASIDT
jgi:hypothetical protein